MSSVQNLLGLRVILQANTNVQNFFFFAHTPPLRWPIIGQPLEVHSHTYSSAFSWSRVQRLFASVSWPVQSLIEFLPHSGSFKSDSLSSLLLVGVQWVKSFDRTLEQGGSSSLGVYSHSCTPSAPCLSDCTFPNLHSPLGCISLWTSTMSPTSIAS